MDSDTHSRRPILGLIELATIERLRVSANLIHKAADHLDVAEHIAKKHPEIDLDAKKLNEAKQKLVEVVELYTEALNLTDLEKRLANHFSRQESAHDN